MEYLELCHHCPNYMVYIYKVHPLITCDLYRDVKPCHNLLIQKPYRVDGNGLVELLPLPIL